MTYCVHGCKDGWLETDSTYGTPCPDHPPQEPTLMKVGEADARDEVRTGGEFLKYREYLKSPEWQRRRRHALQRADFLCQNCNKRDKRLEVHHLTYARRGHELPTDLIVLCRACHEAFHEMLGMPA